MWEYEYVPSRGTTPLPATPRSGQSTVPSPRTPNTAKQLFGRPPGSAKGAFRRPDRSGAGKVPLRATSPFFGEPSPSSFEYGCWRPGKQRLPERVRQEVSLQRDMARMLDHIIDKAHFQDADQPQPEPERLVPYTEEWPTVEFPDWPEQQERPRTPIDVLLQQSDLYSQSAPNKSTSFDLPDNASSRQDSGKGSKLQVEELQHSVSRRSEVRRNTSKKPGVPKNAVKKSTSGWSQLRLAATVFRPFGGIGDAMKQRNSKEEEEERTKAEEEASEERKEAERLQEEEAQRQASRSANFDMCLSLSKQYLTPLEEVRRVFEEFKQMDTSGDLLISEAEFEASARSNLSWPEDQELPDHLQRKLRRYFKDMDKDNSEYIDFPEFFDWSLRNRWTEEFLARDDKDLENRRLAREAEVPLSEVERYRNMFNEFDTDGSDEISQGEFVFVIMQIMEVKDPRDISTHRLNRYWQEVDTDGSGSVSFQEFLAWMLTKGPEHVKRVW